MADKKSKKLKKRIQSIKERKASITQDFSDIMLQFCRPLLAEAETLNGEDNAVGLGVFAWNAAFLDKNKWEENLRNSLNQFSLSDEAQTTLIDIVEEMIRQKSLMYPHDMRVITNYEVHVDGKKVTLDIEFKIAKKGKSKGPEAGEAATNTFG